MKRIFPIVLFTFFIILGVSLLVFVVNMFKIHADSMGNTMEIMMRKEMVYEHLRTWIKQKFWIPSAIIGIVVIISFMKKK